MPSYLQIVYLVTAVDVWYADNFHCALFDNKYLTCVYGSKETNFIVHFKTCPVLKAFADDKDSAAHAMKLIFVRIIMVTKHCGKRGLTAISFSCILKMLCIKAGTFTRVLWHLSKTVLL